MPALDQKVCACTGSECVFFSNLGLAFGSVLQCTTSLWTIMAGLHSDAEGYSCDDAIETALTDEWILHSFMSHLQILRKIGTIAEEILARQEDARDHSLYDHTETWAREFEAEIDSLETALAKGKNQGYRHRRRTSRTCGPPIFCLHIM